MRYAVSRSNSQPVLWGYAAVATVLILLGGGSAGAGSNISNNQSNTPAPAPVPVQVAVSVNTDGRASRPVVLSYNAVSSAADGVGARVTSGAMATFAESDTESEAETRTDAVTAGEETGAKIESVAPDYDSSDSTVPPATATDTVVANASVRTANAAANAPVVLSSLSAATAARLLACLPRATRFAAVTHHDAASCSGGSNQGRAGKGAGARSYRPVAHGGTDNAVLDDDAPTVPARPSADVRKSGAADSSVAQSDAAAQSLAEGESEPQSEGERHARTRRYTAVQGARAVGRTYTHDTAVRNAVPKAANVADGESGGDLGNDVTDEVDSDDDDDDPDAGDEASDDSGDSSSDPLCAVVRSDRELLDLTRRLRAVTAGLALAAQQRAAAPLLRTVRQSAEAGAHSEETGDHVAHALALSYHLQDVLSRPLAPLSLPCHKFHSQLHSQRVEQLPLPSELPTQNQQEQRQGTDGLAASPLLQLRERELAAEVAEAALELELELELELDLAQEHGGQQHHGCGGGFMVAAAVVDERVRAPLALRLVKLARENERQRRRRAAGQQHEQQQ